MRFITTCLFGLEKLVGEDIDFLGYKRIKTSEGRIEFEAPESAIAEANVNLRYSERVLIKLGAFTAKTFDELFEGAKALPWEDYIGRNDEFPVKGHSLKSTLFSVPDCQAIIKKAVCVRLGSVYGLNVLPETGVKKQIVFFLMDDEACLMIDTSGEGLHKRGYRTEANAAPIRETLAAAMTKFSRPREGVMTLDPMCGSGTIPIEAALLAANAAPGISRPFAAEKHGIIPVSVFDKAREAARERIVPPQMPIYGFDIDKNALAIAQANVKRAGVSAWVKIGYRDATKLTPPEGRGTVVCNPPYGERLMDKESAYALAGAVGKRFAEVIPSWQLYFISSDENFEHHFGRYADRKRTLYNGMIKCTFYQYFKNPEKSIK